MKKLEKKCKCHSTHLSETKPPPVQTMRDETPVELADQVEELHSKIMTKLDAMNSLREELRTKYVPSSVCTQLEQCVKDSEVISYMQHC